MPDVGEKSRTQPVVQFSANVLRISPLRSSRCPPRSAQRCKHCRNGDGCPMLSPFCETWGFSSPQVTLILDHNDRPLSPASIVPRLPSLPLRRVDHHQHQVGIRQRFHRFANADGLGFIERLRMPAVSTSWTGMPPMATVSLTRSRVVPGVAVTIARSRSTSRLNKLDLPTFGRPTIASVNPSCTILP